MKPNSAHLEGRESQQQLSWWSLTCDLCQWRTTRINCRTLLDHQWFSVEIILSPYLSIFFLIKEVHSTTNALQNVLYWVLQIQGPHNWYFIQLKLIIRAHMYPRISIVFDLYSIFRICRPLHTQILQPKSHNLTTTWLEDRSSNHALSDWFVTWARPECSWG